MAAAAVVAFWPSGAGACSFHNYVPTKTAVDWVLTGRAAVLVRPDPENAFSYMVTEVLRGNSGMDAPPFLIDSATRTRLLQNRKDAVLFGLSENGSWIRIAYVKDDYRRALDAVVAKAPDWGKKDYHPERMQRFSNYLQHSDPELRKLALLEIDRAPYALLRQIKTDVPAAYLLELLRSREAYAYRPIVALLLGLNRSVEAQSVISDFIDRSADWAWAEHLGPFATALIEQEGVNGIARLESFLTDPGQPLTKLESVVEAMAIHHGVGTPSIREAVFNVLTSFARNRPGGSVLIARQFSQRQNWAFGASLEPLLETSGNLSSGSKLVVAAYVAQSRVNRGQTQPDNPPVQ
ncbi:MAG: hypothetical protein RDA78_00550 [Roseibium sp.]|uniref:hypothetical protein n=1 Tax=Roseibium sp. TaxID=1936156 RepID=UPI003D9C37B6